MAIAVFTSYSQICNASGIPQNGAKVYVYAAETTTPLTLYSDDDLQSTADNPITTSADGRHPTRYIAAGTAYKVVVTAADGSALFTRDNIDPMVPAGSGALPIAAGGTGGTTAGAARTNLDVPSNQEMADLAQDVADFGTRLDALQLVTPPQGYLTLTSGTPVIASDVSAGTAVYYTPFVGNGIPIWNGSAFEMEPFSELTLTLSASHLASSIYDVFVFFDDNGDMRIGTGPAWNVVTAGGGSRGAGAGTTELERANGIWANKVSITARNGSTTYTVAPRYGAFVGSLFMDGTNGQITCHRSWGASRKWGVSNAYNRQPVILKAGDSTASWTYTTDTLRPSRDQTTNSLTVFQCLPEELYDLKFQQKGGVSTTQRIGIGFNSTTAASGYSFDANVNGLFPLIAEYIAPPSIGINTVTALEAGTGGASTFYGTEAKMVLYARWRA